VYKLQFLNLIIILAVQSQLLYIVILRRQSTIPRTKNWFFCLCVIKY